MNRQVKQAYLLGGAIGFITAMTYTYVWCYVSFPAGIISAIVVATGSSYLSYRAWKSKKARELENT